MARSLSLTLLGLVAWLATALGTAQSPEVIETFKPPKPLERSTPIYPRSYQLNGREGWVTTSYMIDTAGLPYDISVVASSGDKLFEKAALKAVEGFKYEAATLDGKAIDASAASRITFELSGDTGAAKRFINRFRTFQRAMEQGQREKAEKKLAELGGMHRNLYEEAFYQMAKYLHAAEWGTIEHQYAALTRATYIDKGRSYLPDHLLTGTLRSLYSLQLKLSHFADARQTAKRLVSRELTPGLRAQVEDSLARIDDIERAERPIFVQLQVADSYRASHMLLRRSLALENVEGDVAEIRLHCERGYVGFKYEAEMVYSVQPNAGNCRFTAIGDPGTKFRLVEVSG